jgi:2-oxo-4-hydroxy-4-carboxy-5-ureidoimidazoline decarboxylase
LSEQPHDAFLVLLGGVFEHSPWVAEAAWPARPFTSVDQLHRIMCEAVRASDAIAQSALIQAHPELAGKAAVRGELTPESSREQSGAGLDQCTAQELALLQQLNRRYRERFGLPFILAVRGYDRDGIIGNLRARLGNTREAEREESLRQICRIARLRLDDLFAG